MAINVEMPIFWCVLIVALGQLRTAQTINVLGIVSSPSKSHSVFANAIFNEYANSGHSVTVLSPFDVSPRINHYKLDGMEKVQRNYRSNWNVHTNENSAMLQLYEEGLKTTEFVVNHESFKRLISSQLNVDVIIFDYDHNDALLAIADRYKCPVFILSLNQPSLSLKRLMSAGYPLANLIFHRPTIESSFMNSFWNMMSNLYELFIVDVYYQNQQKVLYTRILNEFKLTTSFKARNSLKKVFTSSLSQSSFTSLQIANVPSLHIREKSMLELYVPEKLDQFIHSTEQGCIYVSLGSNINPANLPEHEINVLFKVFMGRPEKIIWAWNGNTTTFEGSSKFFIAKWLPQDDVLRHRNIKAFVTNGGSLSIQEAIYHEVPIIGIPLTYQQRDNIDFMVSRGLGVKIEFEDLTVESMQWALNEVVNNKRYLQNMALEGDLMKNPLLSPMKVVKFWITHFYQHRHDNIPDTNHLSVIDYYFSDVYLSIFFTLSMLLTITVIICSLLYKIASKKIFMKKQKLY